MTDIDPASPIPLYYQLKLLLQAQIEKGQLQPGDKIPTEAELCAQYEISRTPVRQAVLALTREGLLTRTVGRGTFVAPRPQDVTTLRVAVSDERWQWPLAEAARLWNEAHAPARIELHFQTVPLAELHDHLSLAVAQGRAPDISVLDSVWVAEFAHRRYLYAVAEIDEAWAAKARGDFYPALLQANSYRGQLYAVPTNADTTVLWYRRDFLKAEGCSPPQTWDDLLAVARHFRKANVRSRYGLSEYPLIFAGGQAAGETTTYQLLPFLWSNGAKMVSDKRIVLDSPATRRALSFLRDLVQEEEVVDPRVTEIAWDGPCRAFARGEVVLAFGGTYENYHIQTATGWDGTAFAERVGFVPLPAGPQGVPATLVGGMTYGIYRQTERAQEALALLKLALTPAILKPYSLQTGQNPANRPVLEAIQPAEGDFLGGAARLLTQAGSRPTLPAYDLISRQFQEMVALCLSGKLSVGRAVSRAAERMGGITGLPVG